MRQAREFQFASGECDRELMRATPLELLAQTAGG